MHATRAPGGGSAPRRAFERDGTCPFHLNATRKTRALRYASGGMDFMEDRARDDTLPSGPLRFPDRTFRVIV